MTGREPRARWHRRIFGALVVAGAVGCSNLTDSDEPDVGISFERFGTSAIAGLTLGTDLGGRPVTLAAAPNERDRAQVAVRGPSYGAVPVRVALLSAAHDTLASVAFSQTFSRGNHHWVGGVVSVQRPLGTCVGSVAAAPIKGRAADSLFVMYGGLPAGAVC